VPNTLGELLQRGVQAFVPEHGIAMITEHQVFIFCATLSIALSTGMLPRTGLGMRPPEVSLSELENPCMVQSLELL
jgi:hypothetical protein